MSIEARIRKYQNIVQCGARALVGFALWSTFRYFIMLYFNYSQIAEEFDITGSEETEKAMVLALVVGLSLCDILVKYYIGRKGTKISKGGRHSLFYIAFCILYIGIGIIGDVSPSVISAYSDQIGTYIVYVIIELTSYLAVGEIAYSCLMIKKLEKAQINDEGEV